MSFHAARRTPLLSDWVLVIACTVSFGVSAAATSANEAAALLAGRFAAADTLAPGRDSSADAQQCLDALCWPRGAFQVDSRLPAAGESGDAIVTFPSPVPGGDQPHDVVVLEWYAARDSGGRPIRAPAVVVVHESGSRMTVGRLIAQGFRPLGVHAFLIHLPHYGLRRGGARPDGARFLPLMRQGVADVRRARDAVAALPLVDAERIALQGTSLGGIIAATTAGLDAAYDRVFLMLAGGDLYGLLQNGQRDAARFREELERAGVVGDELRAITRVVEPLRLAHRVDPARVWLYTANYDQVIPAANSAQLAEALRIEPGHHVQLAADHYTGIIYLPLLLEQMVREIRRDVE